MLGPKEKKKRGLRKMKTLLVMQSIYMNVGAKSTKKYFNPSSPSAMSDENETVYFIF